MTLEQIVAKDEKISHDLDKNKINIDNKINNNNKDNCRKIEAQHEHERSLIPPYRKHPYMPPRPPVTNNHNNYNTNWEDRGGVPSSVASTASSFLEAAAIPPTLRSTRQEATSPGAVCVPGLPGSFDNEHDNLFYDEDDYGYGYNYSYDDHEQQQQQQYQQQQQQQRDHERDHDYEHEHEPTATATTMTTTMTGMARSTTTSTPNSRRSGSLSVPQSLHSNVTDPSSMAMAIAELAPDHSYSEQDVEARVAERLEAQVEARISERLQREVDRRMSQENRQHAIAEVVSISNSSNRNNVNYNNNNNNNGNNNNNNNNNNNIRTGNNKNGKIETSETERQGDENFKICGIRRTCWGLILCIIVLLIVGGMAGTYLWYFRAREEQRENKNNNNNNNGSSTVTDNNTLLPETTAVPSNTKLFAPTVSPMPSSPGSTNDHEPSTAPISTMPSATTTMNQQQRRDYLITRIGPFVVPRDFVGNPEMYFVADVEELDANSNSIAGNNNNNNNSTFRYQYQFRNAALDWMATNEDLERTTTTGVVSSTTSVRMLVERYALAVLYFSTGGNQTWTDSLSFLASNKTVCDWNSNNDENNRKIQEDKIVGNVAVLAASTDISTGKNNATTTTTTTTVEEDPDPDNNRIEKGVFCSGGSRFVTSIEIPDNVLQGTIPWELSLLQYLVKINFDTNKLYGSIPKELSRLSRLQALWLATNDLTGELPREFADATQLASIDLEENRLSSTVPSQWGLSLSNLLYVGLRLNALTGTLPSEWQRLRKLQTLDLGGNRLDGTIPQEYGELTDIEELYLESNRFEGSLPPTFGKLTNLLRLFVDDNRLTGTVPTEYSALTSSLEYFWFHGNAGLTGSVNSTFCDPDRSVPVLWLNGEDASINLKSNCLSNDLDGSPAQIECPCCTSCCDSNGTNCTSNSSR